MTVTPAVFEERLSAGYSLYDAAVEGDFDGTYPVGSKAALHSKLQLGKSLVEESPGNSVLLDAAYKIVDQAIKTFEASRITVDKSRLSQWLATASAWVTGKADGGTAASGMPSSNHSFADGEYTPLIFKSPAIGYEGPVTQVKNLIVEAQAVLDNVQATQAAVNAMLNKAVSGSDWELFEAQRLSAYDIEIMVLDSIGENAQISPHASDISPHAVMLQQQGPDYYQAYANFVFNNSSQTLTDSSIRQVSAAAATGLFGNNYTSTVARIVNVKKNDLPNLTGTPQYKSVMEQAYSEQEQLTPEPAENPLIATVKVYQSMVRSQNRTYKQTDMLWQGLWKLQYPLELPEAQRKTVFISFNKAYLDELKSLLAEARQLRNSASEGSGAGQHSAYQIGKLQDAIDLADKTATWLAAPRPQILTATNSLQAAIDAFEASASRNVYFSAVDATKPEFSRMETYFQKPAFVATNDDGTLKVTLTIVGSSSVPEFKVKNGNEYVEAATVSENGANDTRVVAFTVNSLSDLLDAQVRTVVPAANYDRTHSIRLNFNNVNNQALYELLQTATAAHQAAVVGTEPGQYPALAKTALANAIALANEEAVRLPAEQSNSAAAQLLLSRALDTFKASYNPTPGTNTPEPGTPNPGTGSGAGYPADGYHHMNFRILKDGSDAASMAYDYVVNQALVEVRGSSRIVKFVVKQSNEIKYFTIGGSSESVISRNSDKNTRVVSFSLPSLTGKLSGTVRIDWDAFNYHHTYDVQFLFNEASAASAGSSPSVPGAESNGNVGVGPDKVDEYKGETPPVDATSEENALPGENTAESGSGTPSIKFTDTSSHWARSSIEQAIKLGIVSGYADGSFRPNSMVTRGEFAVMISRALNLEGEGDTGSLQDFGNIPSWARAHVARAVALGIIGGFEDGTFRSGSQLSRAQLAVIIARAAQLEPDANAKPDFADTVQIPAWAQKEIAAAVKAGLIQGKVGNRFDPNATATRAEALTLIIRLLERNGSPV
ncbi:NEAT domain-containing protein [Cohnella faecalis]|uniref:S-layer homology domain-containing protein n=1 Tax=Cohnella faecalis TaxID=2315694 RepID=A0A398CNU3_9BACL|nr:NEAT domain-containing protein [Cohnella faecalis]RIE02929.1 hypothetical protein D3H35_20180 [Cohnella faecalis]